MPVKTTGCDSFTNAIAPLPALMDRIPEGGKVGILTSRMGSIADNDAGGRIGHRMSKAAVNAAGNSRAVDPKPRCICVARLHPGFVHTDMTGHRGSSSMHHSTIDTLVFGPASCTCRLCTTIQRCACAHDNCLFETRNVQHLRP